MQLPANWVEWDGRQRATCLLQMAVATLPASVKACLDKEALQACLSLELPEMQQWVDLVGPLLQRQAAQAKALARRADPESSQESAEEILRRLGQRQRHALECVRKKPGLTQLELGREFPSSDPRAVGRRLNELEREGLLVRGEARKCSVSGKRAQTWWPVAAGPGETGGQGGAGGQGEEGCQEALHQKQLW